MKFKFLIPIVFSITAAAQTVNQNHIRPANTNSYVLTTVGGATVWAPSGSGLTQFQTEIIAPVSGQFVIVYPSTGTVITSQTSTPAPQFISPTSAFLNYNCPNTLCIPGSTSAVWSGFTLPSYVVPANVTAVYGFSISNAASSGPVAFLRIRHGSSELLTPANGTQPGWDLQQTTALLSGVTGTNIGAVTLNADTSGSLFGEKISTLNAAAVGLIVYYTGTAPPANNAIIVAPPLYLNPASNTLGIDTTYPFPGSYWIPYLVSTLPTAASFPV